MIACNLYFLLTLFSSWLCFVKAASYPCSSGSFVDSYSSLPNAPNYPSVTYSESGLSESNLVQNHDSEIAVMARPSTGTVESSQTDCPHKQSGLKNWHDSSIWPEGTIPNANNVDVSIPANTKVLISSCSIDPSIVYGIITVPSTSELIFSDADINFQAKGFRVQGALRIGSKTCRLRSKLKITIHGSRGAQSLPTNEWIKGIYVTGQIDIHGAHYTPTWTRLARTVEPGSNVILVQDLVNWQPGQQIVVTTTELKDSRDFNRNEVFTITAVEKFNARTSAIRVSTSAQYRHYGGVEYQAEVGLLSRNIVIQGDASGSPPTDNTDFICTDPSPGTSTFPCNDKFLTGFGAHVMVAGSAAEGRFSGLELFRVGQTNVLARYPIHFHMMGAVTHDKAFAKDCSVHESYFRCYAIHGTSGALVTENVAYDAIGHCYFLEDGVEENSTISFNLGAHIHTIGPVQNPSLNIGSNGGGSFYSQELSFIDESSTLILPSDLSASVFYITNPANYFLGNAASGGWAGFGFPALRNAVKLHENSAEGLTPKDRPLLQFKGNTAHSTGFYWGSAAGIYVGGELFHKSPGGPLTYTAGRVVSATRDACETDPKASGGWCPSEGRRWQRFEDTKVFLVNGRGIQHWGDRAEIVRFETWDCGLSMNVFGSVLLEDGLSVCRSLNHQPTFLSGCPSTPSEVPANPYQTYNCNTRDRYFFQAGSAFQFYDVGQRHILKNIEYRHCNWPQFQPCYWNCEGGTVFTLLSHSSQFVPELMQATAEIKYTNCTEERHWKFSTDLVEENGPTISGRIQAWYDKDGSASGTQRRTMLGSTRANRWWKYNDQCTIKDEMWVCPLLHDQDSSASLVIRGTHPNETNIGSTQCMNGEEIHPRNCPVIGKATLFGFKENDDSLEIGLNAKITGPLAAHSGGWFLRLQGEQNWGTPREVIITSIQVASQDIHLLALPYPTGTVFDIRARAASWCNSQWSECEKNFTQVETLDEVRFGDGSTYFFESNILYIRAATQLVDQFGSRGELWSLPSDPPAFERSGMSLVYTSDQYKIVIQASSCGGGESTSDSVFGYCDPVPQAGVPASLGPVPLCTFPKPDWNLKCVFKQPHIELLVEFCVYFVLIAVVYGRTYFITCLRDVAELVWMRTFYGLARSRRGYSEEKSLIIASMVTMLIGFALIICAADVYAVQAAASIVATSLFASMFILGRQGAFTSTSSAKHHHHGKLLMASYLGHILLIALTFVVSYFTEFLALRLYVMLPAVCLVLHPLWTAITPQASKSSSSETCSGLSSSTSDKLVLTNGGKDTCGSSLPMHLFKQVSILSVGLILIGFALTTAALYFAFVVATLHY